MATTETTSLPSHTPGTTHTLLKHSFGGADAARSAYLQAGTHADEHPGLLVLQHVIGQLQVLEQQGRILGRIVIVPFANPVGLGQQVFGQMVGRYNLANGENFNRNFPDITQRLIAELKHNPPAKNDLPAIKALFAKALTASAPNETVAANKYWLLKQALEHDILLDLHCDTSSILHIYANLNQRQRALDLAVATGVDAVFLEDEAGGLPLDECYAKAWKEVLKLDLVDTAHLGFSATLELRGQADVDDDIAAEDARGIIRFFQREGLVEAGADAVEAPCRSPVTVYPLEGVSHLMAPATGIVAWKKQIGDAVEVDEVIAQIVPVDGVLGAPRYAVLSNVSGRLIARHHVKLARSGQKIGMLAGTTPLPERQTGKLMGL